MSNRVIHGRCLVSVIWVFTANWVRVGLWLLLILGRTKVITLEILLLSFLEVSPWHILYYTATWVVFVTTTFLWTRACSRALLWLLSNKLVMSCPCVLHWLISSKLTELTTVVAFCRDVVSLFIRTNHLSVLVFLVWLIVITHIIINLVVDRLHNLPICITLRRIVLAIGWKHCVRTCSTNKVLVLDLNSTNFSVVWAHGWERRNARDVALSCFSKPRLCFNMFHCIVCAHLFSWWEGAVFIFILIIIVHKTGWRLHIPSWFLISDTTQCIRSLLLGSIVKIVNWYTWICHLILSVWNWIVCSWF